MKIEPVRRCLLVAVLAIGMCVMASASKADAQTSSTLPPARAVQPEDLARLAGVWEGFSIIPGGGSAQVTATIKPNGEFMLVGRAATPGRLWISDGKIQYESAFSTGMMTLHEGDGKRVLVMNGAARNGRGNVHAEFTQK